MKSFFVKDFPKVENPIKKKRKVASRLTSVRCTGTRKLRKLGSRNTRNQFRDFSEFFIVCDSSCSRAARRRCPGSQVKQCRQWMPCFSSLMKDVHSNDIRRGAATKL